QVVNEQFVMVDALSWVALGAVVAGGVLLVRRDAQLGRLWLALGAVPFATAAVIGAFSAFLLPRTLTLASWAPVVAVAFLLEAARRRWDARGVAIAVLVPALVLLASVSFLGLKHWDYDMSINELQRVAQPGDLVAVRPARYGILADWRFDVRGPRPTREVAFDEIRDTDVRLVLGAPSTGRLWMLTTVDSPTRFERYRSCAEPWTDGVTTVLCLTRKR
ncbi:MAG TPA: hypothetical protein VFZ17_13800, partial [Acidimicrobiia bacterium]|nr:hypothetical protein [Acidimicrobiia bacterium]